MNIVSGKNKWKTAAVCAAAVGGAADGGPGTGAADAKLLLKLQRAQVHVQTTVQPATQQPASPPQAPHLSSKAMTNQQGDDTINQQGDDEKSAAEADPRDAARTSDNANRSESKVAARLVAKVLGWAVCPGLMLGFAQHPLPRDGFTSTHCCFLIDMIVLMMMLILAIVFGSSLPAWIAMVPRWVLVVLVWLAVNLLLHGGAVLRNLPGARWYPGRI